MDKSLKNIIDKYSTHNYIDIEFIARQLWLVVEYIDFEKINWVIIDNIIWINKNLAKDKQRFTIAHELCHFILNEKGVSTWVFATRDKRESRADEFATIILLPEKAVIKAWYKYKSINAIAKIFCVPKDAVRNRLIGLIFLD